MKEVYKCDVCSRDYNLKADALECENTHTIIVPKEWYWYIPIFNFFLMPFLLFTKKNAIIKFNDLSLRGIIVQICIFGGTGIFIVGFLMLLCIITK